MIHNGPASQVPKNTQEAVKLTMRIAKHHEDFKSKPLSGDRRELESWWRRVAVRGSDARWRWRYVP